MLGDFWNFIKKKVILTPFGWHFAHLYNHLEKLIAMIWKPFGKIKLLSSFSIPLLFGQVQNMLKAYIFGLSYVSDLAK